jgi:hypothetical protein
MLAGIDHVIVACADPDAALAELGAALGLRAGGGGRHEASGTFNRLVWFGDSYLELVGIFDRDLADQGLFGGHLARLLDAAEASYGGMALATDDLTRDVELLRGQGSLIGDPLDGERLRPDGRVVRWRTGRLPEPDSDLGLAFLIEHDTTAAEWTAAERSERVAEVHPMGTPARLLRIEVPVSNTARATQRLHRDLGLAFRPSLAGTGARDTSIGSQLLRLVPSLPGAVPRIVIRGGLMPSEAALLGCRWVTEPAPEAS